jgi:hypothetical protein
LIESGEMGVLFFEGVVLVELIWYFRRPVTVLPLRVLAIFLDTGLTAILLDCVKTLFFTTANIVGVLDTGILFRPKDSVGALIRIN